MKRGLRPALAVIMGLGFPMGVGYHTEAGATTAIKAQEAGSTITIGTDSADPKYTYTFAPAQLDAKVGQAITVTNEDPNGVHSVTAQDKSFNVDVPPKGSVTFKVTKAGSFPYYCQYHSDQHNPASINVS
jgi:plastocyanin